MPQLIKGVFQGETSELYENSVRKIYTAILRKDSGATLNDDEIAEMKATVMIQAGNSPELIAQKMDNLRRETESLGATLPSEARARADEYNASVRATPKPEVVPPVPGLPPAEGSTFTDDDVDAFLNNL